MWGAGCRMPTQSPEGWSVCFCGARITVNGVDNHIRTIHMGQTQKSRRPGEGTAAEFGEETPKEGTADRRTGRAEVTDGPEAEWGTRLDAGRLKGWETWHGAGHAYFKFIAPTMMTTVHAMTTNMIRRWGQFIPRPEVLLMAG